MDLDVRAFQKGGLACAVLLVREHIKVGGM